MATIAEQLTSLANTKAAIKQSIIDKGVAVADTDPFSAYPAKIGQISGGSAPATKFGVSIDNLLGDVDENGKYILPTGSFVFNGNAIKSGLRLWNRFYESNCTEAYLNGLEYVTTGMLNCAFENSRLLTTAQLLNVKTIDGGLQECFQDCTALRGKTLSVVEEITGAYSCQKLFYNTGIDETGLDNLRIIDGSDVCSSMYGKCQNITRTGLENLVKIDKASAVANMFSACRGLTKEYFYMLTEVPNKNAMGYSTSGMFTYATNLTEIHFRKDVQSQIEAQASYAKKLGATNATIYFDLIGTITVDGVAYSRYEPGSIKVDGVRTYFAWKDASDNIVYTNATAEPAVDTPVYSDAGTTQVGTVSEVA